MMNAENSTFHPMPRRRFLKRSGLALGAAGFPLANHPAAAAPGPAGDRQLIAERATVLFQGDSITDAGRSRAAGETDAPNNQPGLGNGYAWLAAAGLLVSRPAAGLKIFNRGISGNKVYQLAERWEQDCLALKPEVVSILVGVNDFWHTRDPRLNYRGTVEIYERDYQALVARTQRALPKVRLVLCEPFVLRCGVVREEWFPEFDQYRAAARRVAEKHRAVFIPLQTIFDEATKYAPPEHWAGDGVHPTAAGASLMAHCWLKAVGA